jgi:hypothetical protein
MKVLLLVLMGAAALSSCSSGGASFEFFVVIKPNDTEDFVRTVQSIATQNGLETAVGRTVADTGKALTVVEGRGSGLKLWVQNVSLSGKEDPKVCSAHFEPYPDPAQFMVFTEPRLFGSKAEAIKLGERVFSHLQKLGFDVRRKPAICGQAVHQNP